MPNNKLVCVSFSFLYSNRGSKVHRTLKLHLCFVIDTTKMHQSIIASQFSHHKSRKEASIVVRWYQNKALITFFFPKNLAIFFETTRPQNKVQLCQNSPACKKYGHLAAKITPSLDQQKYLKSSIYLSFLDIVSFKHFKAFHLI